MGIIHTACGNIQPIYGTPRKDIVTNAEKSREGRELQDPLNFLKNFVDNRAFSGIIEKTRWTSMKDEKEKVETALDKSEKERIMREEAEKKRQQDLTDTANQIIVGMCCFF